MVDNILSSKGHEKDKCILCRKILLLSIAIGLLITASLAFASIYYGTVTFTCTQVIASGTGSHVLDRDNTGEGDERVRVDVTDGNGTLIYTFTYQNTLGTYDGGIGTFTYTTPPAANPLTFTLTSLAGNGLPEQVDYVAQGTCADLPTVATAACPIPRPAGARLYDIPAGALAFFAPRSDAYTGFDLPPGTWYVSEQENGFAKVWIACQANMIWVPVENILSLVG